MNKSFLLEQAESLQNMMVSRATGGDASPWEYAQVRQALLSDSSIASMIPQMVKTCRTPDQFWGFIRKLPSYAERREYVWGEFRPLLDKLEMVGAPSDMAVTENLERYDSDYIHAAWQKVLSRRVSDPEGAITMAKTLVESVCKHIIEEVEGHE